MQNRVRNITIDYFEYKDIRSTDTLEGLIVQTAFNINKRLVRPFLNDL